VARWWPLATAPFAARTVGRWATSRC
jgi:hypothetical protein